MEKQLGIFLRYLAEAIGGFMAGAAFAMSLVIGVALFVGNVLMQPALGGSEMERILDYVAGPAALLFSVVGIAVGVVRAGRQTRAEQAGGPDPDPIASAGEAVGGFALAVVVAIAVGALAWPWLIITMTDRGIDTGALIGATAIPIVVGLIVFIAWRVLRARKARAVATGPTPAAGPGAAVRRTAPALVAVAVGSSALLAAGTMAAVSDWHQILFVLFGLPLSLTMFFAHLFSCIWFFRPMPPRM